MRIDKIELIGFKSFAEKTTFQFNSGITCIVGPNGCGKSNIVDAFRWVLGEQSAKSLRGEKMEEVIFHGSVSKKPRGMAEVTMVLSGLNVPAQRMDAENGDPSDTASVTRRLYRSGDSEYMLNKSQCRLKDVKNLFLDTGLEVKSYSILEQDRIAEILNSKPLERRFLIEEVAGIMKYNVRKKEALSKLESSRTNLQRINDIIVEVKKQINFLDRLARKAEKYKKLISEIHSIELKIAQRDYHLLKGSFGRILSEYNSLREEESAENATISKIENETETRRLELIEKEKIVEELQMKFQNLEKEIAELEKSIAVAKTERDNNKEYLAKLYQQDEEYSQKMADLSSRQKELDMNEQNLLSEKDSRKELLREKVDLLRSMEEELADKEDLIDGKRREIFRLSEELSELRNNQSRFQSSLDNLKHRESSSVKDSGNLKAMLSEIDLSTGNLESKLLQENNDILLLNERKGIIVNEIASTGDRIESLRETISNLKEELASSISRTDSLKEIVSEGSGTELLDGENFNLLASISDVIETEDEYEKAVESVLSEKVNSLILPSFNDIESAIVALKKKELGRTAFIPVNPMADFSTLRAPAGTIGKMLDFIRVKEDFARVAESLFGNIFLVRDLKTAINLVSSGHNLFFATPDGDVVEPTGTVIAGEVRGIFRRKREIRELQSVTEQIRNRVDHVQADLKTAQEMMEIRETDLKEIETALVSKEKEISLLKLTTENYREEKERHSRKLAYITLEMEQITREKESIEKNLVEKEAEISSVDSKKTELESQGASLQEEISRERLALEEYRGEVTDIRLVIASLNERVESVGKEKENIAREIDESNRKKEFLLEEISSVRSRILQRETETAGNEETIKSLVGVADGYRQELSDKKEIIDSENQELLHAEQGLKLLRKEIASVSQRIAELDIQKAEHKLKMDTLSENVRQNYGLAIDVIEVESLTEEDEKRLDGLKEKIRELGPVNLGTLEEYEELRTRYEFLKNQQEDLNKSIAELEEAVAKINITTRKRLREAFEALKTKFAEVFLALFGGGRAELVMTDENNILETGIDIIAQPPGKRLQNINLLSGGEKTLTALSLLFASFLIKPTPLCILDEADSALDEMNTEKFSNILKDFSKDTQFIVVTHNRNTMSVADHIYGITMEEAGSSKVITMQLVEAA